jgi:uncharacterized membrane protein
MQEEEIMNIHRKRSFVKAISWRTIATSTTMALVFLITGELSLAAGVGILDVTFKFILYYGHERLWNLIKWGKSKKTITRKNLKNQIEFLSESV